MSKLNVVLTGTTNPYLQRELPIHGEIELCEVGTDGSLITAVFRAQRPDGRLAAPVHVGEPEFIYTPNLAATISDKRQRHSYGK